MHYGLYQDDSFFCTTQHLYRCDDLKQSSSDCSSICHFFHIYPREKNGVSDEIERKLRVVYQHERHSRTVVTSPSLKYVCLEAPPPTPVTAPRFVIIRYASLPQSDHNLSPLSTVSVTSNVPLVGPAKSRRVSAVSASFLVST